MTNGEGICPIVESWGISELKALKVRETEDKYYLKFIPIHRKDIARVKHGYYCHCLKDYEFKESCSN